jgi:hypothetical protein
MKKILILTDSIANPRPSPITEETSLEETYPYLLRDKFKNVTFYQLSFGNITTEEILNQAIGYLSNWKPDFVIVHSGINDCRPEAFSEREKGFIRKLSSISPRLFAKYLYSPTLIKLRQLTRVSESRFEKTLKKFKLIFKESVILWIEIAVGPEYEKIRPGVLKRIKSYNNIITSIYGDNVIKIYDNLLEKNGLNMDSVHWNVEGHKDVYNILLERINNINNRL